ncbi:PD-(D/E)XK nuclease family protein [Winogradskyella maritima]|uniref:PD-(D/E)XK nuclease family protein n=1 Tax=Winogradskyella maritima TaxID=1517766 RepID=A0ABV8AHH3_9FLAO|nr:PD-(D/E)XK nuclease family protein [Winogradskyella maritima]
MQTFIDEVLKSVLSKSFDFKNLIFVLPSKRAGTQLKKSLAESVTETTFSPLILSIEEFVEQLSELNPISNTELLFEFYKVYLKVTPQKDVESFESFAKWAQIIIQDFNEIDRYLIESNQIFDYLKDIQELKSHWANEDNRTQLIARYLSFWANLKTYYNSLKDTLIEKGVAYQGLMYREAVSNLKSYSEGTKSHHIFLGFNALNTAESQIIQHLLKSDSANIYWDVDAHFLENEIHDAGYFIRGHLKSWSYFDENPFHWKSQYYSHQKHIEIIGCAKSIGQAKQVGQLLKVLTLKHKTLANTAVVLGEESLLIPVLNSIPKEVKSANVTMGFPLRATPLASLFHKLFSLQSNRSESIYYKDVIDIISHESIQRLLVGQHALKSYIYKNNLTRLSIGDILSQNKADKTLLKLLFGDWNNQTGTALENVLSLIYTLKASLNEESKEDRLPLEYCYRFYTLFNELSNLNKTYPYLKDLKSLQLIFNELLNSETLDFIGEPFQGLQIMGMLETRVLDFENLIITSVNEGLLPAGKSQNSFIPYDVKLENALPTYKEKDAVYTYHFYRLLQRAKNIYILYNTEPDVLKGGEPSRFVKQLSLEGIHDVKLKNTIVPVPQSVSELKQIQKTEAVITSLKAIAEKGFSSSSLTNYIRNPIDFYHQKILGVSDMNEVEETVASNTLGSVIHNTLEDFYKPLEGELLSEDHIKDFKKRLDSKVKFHFEQLYNLQAIKYGKNLIIYEIAKRYVSNFLEQELDLLKKGNVIEIVAIETEERIKIDIEHLDFPVYLTGKVDRIDKLNGITRIIDYKSGRVDQAKVTVADWDALITDYDKYSKSFQVLSYALMMKNANRLTLPVEGGIISFKNLKSGFLKFTDKSEKGNTQTEISEAILDRFTIQLKTLISEICNPNIDFIEKELDR